MRPFPLVLSAPSGGGKTTVARALLTRRDDVGYSVSCTTRAPRPGEVDGEAYHFLSTEAFEAEIAAGAFAEFAQVHGRWYGTLTRELERVMAGGKHVILDIDVQGAEQIARAVPEAVLVFLLPPSGETLLARLTGRNTDDKATILKRMRNALEELRHVSRYHYVVINDDLEHTIRRVGSILDAEVVRHARHEALDDRLAGLMHDLERRLQTFAHS
ncbi:MAG: guanylate kinase [Gemmatimonadaceae bacterium]|jgi:guanylate kinase|nr:guanylate kinase [Gemmatimonadaceae bacterium]